MPTVAGFARLKAAFEPLRSAPDALPEWMQGEVLRGYKGFDPSGAQHVGSSAGRYWLVPGPGEMCLFEVRKRGQAVNTCTPTPIALAHGFSIVSVRPLGKNGKGPYKRRIFGVVPDWARHVLVRTGADVAKPPVRHGTYNLSDWNYNPPDTIVTRPRGAVASP
jgi:hypothetical protein